MQIFTVPRAELAVCSYGRVCYGGGRNAVGHFCIAVLGGLGSMQ